MKKCSAYFLLVWISVVRGQQTTNYIQYIFNKAGINPAASGTNINQKVYYTCGANRQWIAFNNPPKATFANFSFTIRPPRSYSYWQNVGALIESDQSGAFSNVGFYANYTIHLLLRKNLVASFGIYAGARQFFLSPGIIDANDPINKNGTYKTLVYPDVIPGMRLSNKKFFFDISAKQITASRQQDFRGHAIGSPSRLLPSLFIAYGQVFPVNDNMIMLPSIAVNVAVIGPPSISPTLMFYYGNRFGFGISARNVSFISGIFQVRILENLSVGMAYSYSLNKAGTAAPNSYEIMIGVAPMGLGEKFVGRHSATKCPALDF